MREPSAVADGEPVGEETPGQKSSDRVDELREVIRDALGCLRELGVETEGQGRSGAIAPLASRQVSQLLAVAETVQLFRTSDGIAYADLEIDGHRETWAVRDRGFRRWLTQRVLASGAGMPPSKALRDVLDLLEVRALSAGPVREVEVRLGGLGGKIYLDLGDAAWRAIEIDANGWHIVERPPLRFRRPAGALPLPAPERGGSITTLRSFLNLSTEDDLAMIVAWLLAALCDRGPYPVLVLGGEAGAGKSTFMAMMQALIDPSSARLRSLPAGEPALIAAAHDSHVLAFDNLSSLPGWFSDALCRMVSGGGFTVRRDGGTAAGVLAGVARPVMLNGIAELITRPDLADRALFVTLNGIRADKRRTEAELWDDFEAKRPRLLGALLDAVATGLARLPQTTVREAPRMADLARWVEACEPALFVPGAFKSLYAINREGAARDAIESDPFVIGVREFVCRQGRWAGSATQLHDEVAEIMGPRVRDQAWPGNARVLASRLRQGAAFLRRCGIDVAFGRVGAHGKRVIWLFVMPGSEADARRPADATPRSTASLASVASD